MFKVHRNGGEAEIISVPAGGHGKMYGVAIAPSQCVPMSNPCAVDNGQCKHMCLPNSEGARICVCPDNADQDDECRAS